MTKACTPAQGLCYKRQHPPRVTLATYNGVPDERLISSEELVGHIRCPLLFHYM